MSDAAIEWWEYCDRCRTNVRVKVNGVETPHVCDAPTDPPQVIVMAVAKALYDDRDWHTRDKEGCDLDPVLITKIVLNTLLDERAHQRVAEALTGPDGVFRFNGLADPANVARVAIEALAGVMPE